MKANELMIGDWVNWNTYLDKSDYCKIKQLQVDVRTENGNVLNCEPISLTKDILKANGFEHPKYKDGTCVKHIIEYNKEGFMRLCIEKGYFYISTQDAYIHISYVHELQHALHLCGLNELANNFKIE